MNTTVWDFDACWAHLTEAERARLKERLHSGLRRGEDLSGIVLTGANLTGFDFTGANMARAFLNSANLRSAVFEDANLRQAFLQNANLCDSDLSRAELDGAVFTGARMADVKLLAYSISFGRTPINIDMANFARDGVFARGRINETDPRSAEAAYRALKAHFIADGEYDSASWAAFCERLMQRRVLWANRRFLGWVSSWLFGALSGYGERSLQPLLASAALVIGYAVFYWQCRQLKFTGNDSAVSLMDSISFSLATFAGSSLPDIVVITEPVARFAVATEALAGMFVFGVFIFTLTKKYVAR